MQLARIMKRRLYFARRVYSFITFLKNNFDNRHFDMTSNGELDVINRLQLVARDVVLDLGGNKGDWTLAVLSNSAATSIYAFEGVPAIRTEFSRNKNSEFEILLPYVLDEVERELKLLVDPADSGKSTSSVTFAEQRSGFSTKPSSYRFAVGHQVPNSLVISHVRLLKIDGEGAESPVLSGFKHAFRSNKLSIIQFECKKVYLVTRYLLQDFYRLFKSTGFVVGKGYPTFVEIKEYVYFDGIFRGCNCLAASRDLTSDIQRLPR